MEHLTIKALKTLIANLPDDGIITVNNHGEDRPVLPGEIQVTANATISDPFAPAGEDEKVYSCVVRINSWA